MQRAKESVQAFVSKAGHHDTTVHETVSPAVQHETVKPQRHEEIQTAVDREVHQDHYHHTVQPVQDREVLPEKHEHNLGAVQHREIDHRDHDSTKQKLAQVQAGFKDQQTVHDTKHTQSAAPTIAGEHVHHHIHETIQPVVHKETIQPSVVHTTVPIHEVHHKSAQHHDVSELPPVSMSEFKSKGGALTGRAEKYDGFEGEPKNIGGVLGTGHSTGSHSHHEHGSHTHGTTAAGAGLGSTAAAGGVAREAERHHHNGGAVQGEGLNRRAEESTLGGRTDGEKYGNVPGQTHTGSTTTRDHTTGAHTGTTATGEKPSMMQKLNPFKDADGDGKKGLMD